MNCDSRRIPLRVSNNRAYVWDVDDIATIRSQHRLCGVLTGTLPHLSQQNVFLGVPLVLLPEEVVLLVETGVAALVDDPKAHVQPSLEQLKRWSTEQQESIKNQISFTETKSVQESSGAGRAFSDEAQRKRKAREERKRAEALRVATTSSLGDGVVELLASPQPAGATQYNAKGGSTSNLSKPSPIPYTVVVPAASSSMGWYDPSSSSYNSIEAARTAGIWDYPSTLYERARCGVFRGLWEQGYFMGGGVKFGGDCLVYPGDPLRYHSHFVASVLEAPTSTIRPMEIVAHGRLGTATKKAHLLCGWDDEKKGVSYLSIEWAGFG